MGMYDITGWSGGGRRPLTYNLMPGQARNTRVNVFTPSKIEIHNNIGNSGCFGGCYDYGDYGDNSIPKWMQRLMGVGMGMGLLGGILSLFGGRGAKETEGAGGAEQKKTPDTSAKDWVKTIQKHYPDAKLSATPDGRYMLNGKIYDTHDEVLAELSKTPEKPAATTTTTTTSTDTTPAETPATETEQSKLPDIFKNMSGITNWNDLNSKFQNLTGADLYDLSSSNLPDNGIDVTAILDKDKTKADTNGLLAKNGKINISKSQLEEILKGNTVDLSGNFSNGKKVTAALIDGTAHKCIKITSGTQTYILAVDGKAYQFAGSNTDGNGLHNMGGQFTPPPTTPVTPQDTGSSPSETQSTGNVDLFTTPIFNHSEEQKTRLNNLAHPEPLKGPVSAPPPKGNIKYKLSNGQEVNISGAKVIKKPRTSISQRDEYYLQTSDGKEIKISLWDSMQIPEKLK